MPDSVKGFLEIPNYMVEVLLVLKVLLTQYSEVEDPLCCASSCLEASLFFCDNLLRLCLQCVQYDLQHDFAWVAY